MKRFLLISMAFPPKGAVGALRTSRLCCYLPALGWLPEVITTHPWGTINQGDSPQDYFDSEVLVHRTKLIDPLLAWQRRRGTKPEVESATPARAAASSPAAPPPGPSTTGRLKSSLIGLVSTPDHMVFWNLHLLREGYRVLNRQRDIRFILTSTPPHSSLLAGTLLARFFGVPHIIDLRDPWGGRPGVAHCAFRSRLEDFLERLVVRRASRIISSTEGYNQMTRERFPEVEPRRFVSISNCFETEKFDRIEARRSSGKFTLSYLGIFYPKNNPYPFFAALRQWLDRNPAAASEVQLMLVGSGDPHTLGVLEQQGLGEILTVTGRVAHEEAIARVKSADLLLLLMGRGETVHPAWVPAKLYEYLACGKPILAHGPEGVALSMVREAGAGHLVTADHPEGFIDVLDREFAAWVERGRQTPPAEMTDGLQRYTSHHTNQQFANLFDEVDREKNG